MSKVIVNIGNRSHCRDLKADYYHASGIFISPKDLKENDYE